MGRNETTMGLIDKFDKEHEGLVKAMDNDAAAAADMTELNRLNEVREAKQKADDLREAGRLIEQWEPKMAATIAGKVYAAMVAWAKMVEPSKAPEAAPQEGE